jgi:hypothetical protein
VALLVLVRVGRVVRVFLVNLVVVLDPNPRVLKLVLVLELELEQEPEPVLELEQELEPNLVVVLEPNLAWTNLMLCYSGGSRSLLGVGECVSLRHLAGTGRGETYASHCLVRTRYHCHRHRTLFQASASGCMYTAGGMGDVRSQVIH